MERKLTLHLTSSPDPDRTGPDAVVAVEREISANVGQQLAAHCGEVLARFRVAPEQRLEYVSGSVVDLLGHPLSSLYRDPALAAGVIHPDDAIRLVSGLKGGSAVIELRLRHRDGHWVWTEMRAVPVEDGRGRTVLDVVVSDIGARKALEEALATRALHDPLTQVANRSLLLDRLEGALARAQRSGGVVAVLLVDVDRFKLVNDTYGHAAGDHLLATLARRLEAAVRATDTVGRIGGDEFVVVCDGLAAPEDALEMSERIRRSLAEPVTVGDGEIQISGSVGLALADTGATAEQLLGEADAAMYRAKEQGRNRSEVFDETIRHRARRRLELETALRQALAHDEITVHYQPVVTVTDGRVVECEALARWDLNGVPVSPTEFIPIAEDAGLIGALGRHVLSAACAEAAGWPGEEGLAVSVNLSPRQLAQRDLVRVVQDALEESGLPPSRLCVEITESAMVDDLDTARSALTALHSLGVRLSLDDFGTGYSSLLHLRRLPFHQVKVDRSFVAGVGSEPSDTAIVAGVVGLAHALGMMVVAEGVESEGHLSELEALGCELGQGRYWCPPLPGPELRDWLAQQQRGSAFESVTDLRDEPGEKTIRLLVVDDSVEMRTLMRFALETPSGPLRVVGEAGDGTEAVSVAAQVQPDVVLLDLVMPDRGGLDVLPDLLRASPNSRIIVLSGFVSPNLERAAMTAGASAYLTKGLPVPSLIREVVSVAMATTELTLPGILPSGPAD